MSVDITVFIPVRNGAKYLRETLASIAAQSYRGFKTVLLDNCSTDESVAIASNWPGLEIQVERAVVPLGMADNFNRALDLVDTPYFCIMHSDDAYNPRYLEVMRGLLLSAPNSLAGYCNLQVIDANSRDASDLKYDLKNEYDPSDKSVSEQLEVLCGANMYCAPAIFFRREVVEQVGRYRDFVFNLDWDYSIRILLSGAPFVKSSEVLFNYRIHGSQLTSEYVKTGQKYRERIEFMRQHMNEINRLLPRSRQLTQDRIMADTFKVLLWDMRQDYRRGGNESYDTKRAFLADYAGTKVGRKYAMIAASVYRIGPLGALMLTAVARFSYSFRMLRHRISGRLRDPENISGGV